MSSVKRFDIGVVGLGALGSRVTRQLGLLRDASIGVFDERRDTLDRVSSVSGPNVSTATSDEVLSSGVVVIATPAAHHSMLALVAERGGIAVSTSDDVSDVERMLDLDVPSIIGAAFAPGLSGLLARLLSTHLDQCDEIHVSMHGTGGPACAHQHHRALGGSAAGWHDGEWISRPGGSGRELCWFPDPVGPRDCYRAEMADPCLIHRVFPGVDRISGRLSATRRDRFTARLPMLSPPHSEGGVGGLRVEVRGRLDGQRQTFIAGVAERVAVGAAATVSAFVSAFLDGLITVDGAVTTADEALPTALLIERIRSYGLRLNDYVGSETVSAW